jgi:anti-sigma factor RsiW
MMAEKHPDELELLSFVEEELDGETRREVGEHLVACRSCADQVRRLEAGRDALKAAPLLELPGGRREEIMASLPERRDPWRLFRPAKRVLVIAAPVAAAAALVGVFVLGGTQLGGGGGSDDDSGEAAQAGGTIREEAGDAAQEAAPQFDATALVRMVQGPPAEIARLLENEGIPAEVDAEGNVLADGRLGEVRAALAGRPAGDVAVYVR